MRSLRMRSLRSVGGRLIRGVSIRLMPRREFHVLSCVLSRVPGALPVLFLAGICRAQDVTTNPEFQELLDKVNNVIRAAQALLLTLSVLFMMYAAYLHMTSEGQPEKEQKARKAFTGTLIGIAIAVLAEVIRNAIVGILS